MEGCMGKKVETVAAFSHGRSEKSYLASFVVQIWDGGREGERKCRCLDVFK